MIWESCSRFPSRRWTRRPPCWPCRSSYGHSGRRFLHSWLRLRLKAASPASTASDRPRSEDRVDRVPAMVSRTPRTESASPRNRRSMEPTDRRRRSRRTPQQQGDEVPNVGDQVVAEGIQAAPEGSPTKPTTSSIVVTRRRPLRREIRRATRAIIIISGAFVKRPGRGRPDRRHGSPQAGDCGPEEERSRLPSG